MLFKKIPIDVRDDFEKKIISLVPGAKKSDTESRQIMLRWLSAFAPDITYRDAKDFCLPRRRYKNCLWHAFSFQLTDCLAGEEAIDAFNGFVGECFILSEDTEEVYAVSEGSNLSLSLLQSLGNVTVFTKTFSETFSVTGNEETGPYYKKAVE